MTEPQACYNIAKNLYRMILDLTGIKDSEHVEDGMTRVYTRNQLIAATAARYNFDVQWKPWLQNPMPVRLRENGWAIGDATEVHARFEIDPDSVFGILIEWINPAIKEQFEKGKTA